MRRFSLILLILPTWGLAADTASVHSEYEKIIKDYVFVADFNVKDPRRDIGEELFWRYPMQVPRVEFPIHFEFDDLGVELPSTQGSGRWAEHMNYGRVLYLEGKFEDAKSVWLSARARYGKEFPRHRRNDYFIGLAFLALAKEKLKSGVGYEDSDVKNIFSNASTFLSWAFIKKSDVEDPVVDRVAPKYLYNLAAIYWQYTRYSGAFEAAERGLNILRRDGRKRYRPQLRRFLAESHIRNRTYLEAVQHLDTAIRQDRHPKEAGAMFARVGDIYFGLNNYELAEEAYSFGAKIDEELRQINPAQLILRGEALFWLGRFSEAQKILHFALQGAQMRQAKASPPPELEAFAALRVADGYLARKKFEKAKLEYYKVAHVFRKREAGRIAKVRQACLELPEYQGNNVKHARQLLEEIKLSSGVMPAPAVELAWACQVASYAQRDRTVTMVNRVRKFAASYPNSRFLRELAEPVRLVQASRIDQFFEKNDVYSALSFFEKNRPVLFAKVEPRLGADLFAAYTDTFQPEKADEFWSSYAKEGDTDMWALRRAVVAAEMKDRLGSKKWQKRNAMFAVKLPERRWQSSPSPRATELVTRLLNTKSAPEHYPWLLNLAGNWAAADNKYTCDLQYPILSRIFNPDSQTSIALVSTSLGQMIQRNLPEMFKADESCAVSLLDLEMLLNKGNYSSLAATYIGRQDWQLKGGFLNSYWILSEKVYDAGDVATARRLWQVIVDRGPPKSMEVEFSKARLDPTRTEFGKLWEN